MIWEETRRFIYRNARPLDLTRWQHAFEGGSKEDVLAALSAYQNEDGGFGHALEPDCWNPESSPIQTWAATEILREIAWDDPMHSVVQGILRYLTSGIHFDGHTWRQTIPSNDDHPCAPWWKYAANAAGSYNPTAALAGFMLRFAKRGSEAYELGMRIAREACDNLNAHTGQGDMHTIACYVQMLAWMMDAQIDHAVDVPALRQCMSREVSRLITKDTSVWATSYICKPSMFIAGRDSLFYDENCELAQYECSFIEDTQQRDGAWAVTWQWSAYPQAWAVSKNWWKADIAIKNCRFLKAIQE